MKTYVSATCDITHHGYLNVLVNFSVDTGNVVVDSDVLGGGWATPTFFSFQFRRNMVAWVTRLVLETHLSTQTQN